MPAVSPTMEALVVVAPHKVEIREVATPAPGQFEVLARVRAASICGTDLRLVNGEYPGVWPPSYPFTPGHEWAGEVVALGPGADLLGFRIGDRIAGTAHDPCGFCQKCVEGRYNLCENFGRQGLHRLYGHNYQGADATYVVHGARAVFKLPDEIGFEDGSLIDTASQALHVANRGSVRPGDTVAVLGAGGTGLLAGDAALARGAARVMVVEPNPLRRARADEMGFETVDPVAGDPVAAVRRMTGGLGVDVALECAGAPEAVRWGVDMLRRGGRCAVFGLPGVDVPLPISRMVSDELDLLCCRAAAGEMRHVMPLVASGRIRAHAIATHTFRLTEYETALATLADPASGAIKIVVIP
jgi:L-iditol 2-dehydrogenase